MRFRKRSARYVLAFQAAMLALCVLVSSRSFERKGVEISPNELNLAANVLYLKSDGSIVWNHETVSMQELATRREKLPNASPDRGIIVAVDKQAGWDRIKPILELLEPHPHLYAAEFSPRIHS